jgi:hypothetical protein
MTIHAPIIDDVRVLRARVEWYRQLAEGPFDWRTAAEVAEYAEELEAMIAKMESQQQNTAVTPSGASQQTNDWH